MINMTWGPGRAFSRVSESRESIRTGRGAGEGDIDAIFIRAPW